MSLPLVCRCRTDQVHCFDDKTRKPCTGTCGHTVCLEYAMSCSRCPVCLLEGAFNKVTVNYTSIALLEDCRKRFWENWRQWMDTKAPDAGFCLKLFDEVRLLCSICVEPVKIPRICLTCDEETLFKRNQWQLKQHNATVFKLLQRVMCSNCAIDNHEARGHKIVKQEVNRKSKKFKTMAIAQKVLDMFKDAIENKKGVIDCFVRRSQLERIGQFLLKVIEELEYIEEWECGYLGELIKKELIKKYFGSIDEKMLNLFATGGNSVCDCSRSPENLEYILPDFAGIVEVSPEMDHIVVSGCPFFLWEQITVFSEFDDFSVTKKDRILEEAIRFPIDINCPLCVYIGYYQHKKIDFLLKNRVSVIEEFCKTEMIPLDKCCLVCLIHLNNPFYDESLLSCLHEKKTPSSIFTSSFNEKKESKKQKSCYQNCFMKDSTLWNFVIINHWMIERDLCKLIMHEIEQTVGFVDCQLQKVRMKQTVLELYNGLDCVSFWQWCDHWSKPIEMAALLKSFKQQWKSFLFGNGEQKAGSQCKCTVIWNRILENKVKSEKYEDLEIKMIDMASYSLTEEIPGCPMEYNHGIELDMDVVEELEDAVGLLSIDEERELTLVWNEKVKCLIKKIDNEIHQPYTGSCGHTVCLECIEKTINGDCPVCGKEGSFKGPQLNEELLQKTEKIKENAWEMFKELWNSEEAGFGVSSEGKKTAGSLKLARPTLCQGCASVRPHERGEKVDPVPWQNHMEQTTGIFLLKLLEDGIGGENCEVCQTESQKNRRRLHKVLEEFKHRYIVLFDRELIKLKLVEKLIETIDQKKKQLLIPEENRFYPIKENNCSLCVMIDFLDCATNGKQNQNEWMNVIEHLSSNQLPRFEKCCIRCLFHLNNRYNVPCQTKTEVVDIRKLSNAICEGIEKGQLNNFNLALTLVRCKDSNDYLNDKKRWENLIMREYFFCLLQTITFGLSRISFACYLQKIRIYNLVFHFLSEVCDVWHMINSGWIVGWRFIKTSNMVKKLNLQFKKLKDEMDEGKIGIKCECTEIWERKQKIMEKFGHEDCEEKRKLQYLEDSMEEMARFSLEEDLDGCPLEYNHGIDWDEELARKLKASIDLGAENNTNKCLCDVIDSFAPIAKISYANLNHIVSFFINWWKYEATYPHLICHKCIDRLELIQNRLETISGFYNCELRKMRMLETLEEVAKFIQEFLISKGRVFKSDMENMTKLFDNFISQWNLFQFGSDSDQRSLTAGTSCHCTKTLDTCRSLLNAKYCSEIEYRRLMEASEKLAVFKLTEIITGCPLDFDHDIDDACFDPEAISSGTYRCFKLMFCDST